MADQTRSDEYYEISPKPLEGEPNKDASKYHYITDEDLTTLNALEDEFDALDLYTGSEIAEKGESGLLDPEKYARTLLMMVGSLAVSMEGANFWHRTGPGVQYTAKISEAAQELVSGVFEIKMAEAEPDDDPHAALMRELGLDVGDDLDFLGADADEETLADAVVGWLDGTRELSPLESSLIFAVIEHIKTLSDKLIDVVPGADRIPEGDEWQHRRMVAVEFFLHGFIGAMTTCSCTGTKQMAGFGADVEAIQNMAERLEATMRQMQEEKEEAGGKPSDIQIL